MIARQTNAGQDRQTNAGQDRQTNAGQVRKKTADKSASIVLFYLKSTNLLKDIV